MTGLTLRQGEVLAFIRSFSVREGVPPTLREIAQGFGWSSARAAYDHVRALTRKGALVHREGPRTARAYRLAPSPTPFFTAPTRHVSTGCPQVNHQISPGTKGCAGRAGHHPRERGPVMDYAAFLARS